MTDNVKKTSELATSNTVAGSDRIVILKDPAGSPSTRTITVNNFSNSIRFANTTAAGVIKVGENLSVNATGFLNAQNTSYIFTANSSNWNGSAPVSLNEAIDRLAILVKTLNSGTGA